MSKRKSATFQCKFAKLYFESNWGEGLYVPWPALMIFTRTHHDEGPGILLGWLCFTATIQILAGEAE